MNTNSHDQLVQSQFGSQAAAYVTSSVHAQGEDLQEIASYVATMKDARVLDLGCGGGHVSFCVAPQVSEVVAYDLSENMLSAVAATALQKSLGNIRTVQGAAEKLPFADASFDVVITRFSAHHWQNIALGLSEARRVLKPSGKALFADVIAPEETVCDTFLQSIELLRDPSHVRDFRLSEWHEYLHQAGFSITKTTKRRLRLEMESWLARMQTPAVRSEAIRSLQSVASRDVSKYFELEADGTFTSDTATIQAIVSTTTL